MRLPQHFAATLAAIFAAGAAAAPLSLPFDFSHGTIGLDVTVKDTPLYMMLDTGVDPSVIDLGRAGALGLKVDRTQGGEASGEGDARHAEVFPAGIDGLAIGGRAFGSVDALAMDLSGLSAQYGRALDGVLGYSFLRGRIVLIDYAGRRLGLLDEAADAAAMVHGCRRRWSIPLRSFAGDSIPIIPKFRFGSTAAPVSLDTGSNGGITLFGSALDLPGLRPALKEQGETAYAGARGAAKAKTYVVNAPVGFGPFTLPPGQVAKLLDARGSRRTRVANVGNALFAAMKLKILLDYRARSMTFYGGCGD